jgi:integrase/recombinase XerD
MEHIMPQYKKTLRRGIRWYFKFTYEGETYFSKAIYKTQSEARKAESIRFNEAEIVCNDNGMNDINLLELINQRLDYVQAAKSEKYYEENKYYLTMLYKEFGEISVKSINSALILNLLIKFSVEQKKNGFDNYSVNALLRISKALFNHGIRFLKLNITNPCIGIDFFPVKKKIKYIPTDEEINQVLSSCNPEQKQLLEFVRDTGCRISEALNLRSEDVFNGYVILYTKKSKFGNLVPRKARYDTSKLPKPNENGFIFYHWGEEPKFLTRKNDGKWSWHNLRHRFASILSKKGIPVFEIMVALGHSNLETTQRYLQLLDD